MFDDKKQPQYPWNEPEGEAKYEFYTIASFGIEKFNTDVNALAKRGRELIGGVMAGTAHHGYMRREVRK